jgi:hypothetical protein
VLVSLGHAAEAQITDLVVVEATGLDSELLQLLMDEVRAHDRGERSPAGLTEEELALCLNAASAWLLVSPQSPLRAKAAPPFPLKT